jgi:hypothetical protein
VYMAPTSIAFVVLPRFEAKACSWRKQSCCFSLPTENIPIPIDLILWYRNRIKEWTSRGTWKAMFTMMVYIHQLEGNEMDVHWDLWVSQL